ncbi:MAG TPA: tetratricopeptide repeat protein [Thermoguttaceae bacterium]|nr:tetratricopeptide repeat protein [Thermoguttaceae bacterium]
MVFGRLALAQESPEAGDAQYRAADKLQRDGQFELAVAAWNNFLAKNKGHRNVPQATLNLGICYLKSKQHDKALIALQQVLDQYPQASFRDAAYLYLGVTQFSLGHAGQQNQYQAAARTLDTLLRRYPETKYLEPALYYRAECDYALGKKENAAVLYARLIREFPKGRLLPEALYALGATLQELGQLQAAGKTYEQFLTVAPKHPRTVEVMMRRGETLFGTNQYREALAWFAKVAANKAFPLADQAWMRQADCLAQLKQYAQAAELYSSLVREFPNSSRREEANLAAGKCYYLADNSAKAMAVLSKVIAGRGPSLPEATHWSARSLLKQKKTTEAVALLEKTLSEAGGSRWEPQLRLDLADATYEMPKLRALSITLYADVVNKFPEDPVADSALYMAAFAALQEGDFKTSLAYSEQFFARYAASDLLPDVVAVAAESELQLDKLEQAQRRYQDLINRYPNHAETPIWRLRRALILYMQKKYVQTIGAIQPILARLPTRTAQAEAYYLLGSSLAQQNRLEEAVQALKLSLVADANWRQADDVLLVLADVQRQQRQEDEAADTIRHLITTFSKSPLLDQAHFWLAEFAYNKGDMATAAREYENTIRDWPKSELLPNALFGLGWAQLSQKDFAGAEASFDRLVIEFPKSELVVPARFARGTARQQLGKFGPALEDVQALLATKPTGKEKSDALYVLGLCQAGLKRYDEAIKTFQALLQDDSQYVGADKTLYELAWAFKGAGKFDEAAKQFVELAKQHPDSPLAGESVYHAAELQYERKRYDDAIGAYKSLAYETSDPLLKEKALHKLAWCYFSQDQFDRAQEAFAAQREAVPNGRLVADAAFMEGECLLKSKKYDEAIAAYERMADMAQKPLGDDFATLAMLHAGQAAAKLKQWDRSLKLFERAAKAEPNSAYQGDALYEQALIQERLDRPNEAAKLFALVPTKTEREVAVLSRMKLGKLLVRQKKHSEAIRTFYEVIYGGADFPQWQDDATFEAAQCFEALSDKTQAAKLYRELLEKYPKSNKADEANQRLKAIGSP